MAGSSPALRPSLPPSTMNTAGPSPVSAATRNSSASAASGTRDFSPLSSQSSPSRVAVVRSVMGSNSGRGSHTAMVARGASSPAKVDRYLSCCTAEPQRVRALATPIGASTATAWPMSPRASSSATSMLVTVERSAAAPPRASGTAKKFRPSSRAWLCTSSLVRCSASDCSAFSRSTSAAKARTLSRIICCSSVMPRSNRPVVCPGASRRCGLSDGLLDLNARALVVITWKPPLVRR